MTIASDFRVRKTARPMKSMPDFGLSYFQTSQEIIPVLDMCETCEKKLQAAPAMFECRVVQARNLPSRLGHSWRHAQYVAELSVGGAKKTTRFQVKDENPVWDETVFGSIPVGFGGIPVTVRVIGIRHMHDPEIVATKALTIDLRREVPLGDERHFLWQLERTRSSTDDLHTPITTIEVAFSRIDAKKIRRLAGASTPQDGCAMGIHSPEWSRLLRAAVNVVRAVDGIVDIHPYATLALKLLSWVPRVAEERIERDADMKELRSLVYDTLFFVEGSEPSKLWRDAPDDSHLGVLARLMHQITECCRFLRSWANETCQLSGIGPYVQRFKNTMKQLMSSFYGNTSSATDLTIHRLPSEDGAETASRRPTATATGSSAPYSLLCPGVSRHACGRLDVVDNVQHWIEEAPHSDNKRAILVVGEENGASSVAREIATQYSNMGRLASSFTFDVTDGRGMHRPPQLCVTSLAHDLAGFDSRFAAAMRESIVDDPDIAISGDCSRLFEQLVRKPAQEFALQGPVVIVIDGLDFKGTSVERMELPRVLGEQLDLFPANFRFVLTMKTDHDIQRALAPVVEKFTF